MMLWKKDKSAEDRYRDNLNHKNKLEQKKSKLLPQVDDRKIAKLERKISICNTEVKLAEIQLKSQKVVVTNPMTKNNLNIRKKVSNNGVHINLPFRNKRNAGKNK